MFRVLGHFLQCLAMFSIVGGHWAVLQGVAWAQMINEYSRKSTLTEAVGKTFGGEHPCGLCKKIAKGRESEEKAPATVKVNKKAEILFSPIADNFFQPRLESTVTYRSFVGAMTVRGYPPSEPVPRTV